MAVLIRIYYRWYLHDNSDIWLFHLSGHGLVSLQPDMQGSYLVLYSLAKKKGLVTIGCSFGCTKLAILILNEPMK